MTDKTENNCSEDPCICLCFPCIFTSVIVEKIIESCCICICCMTPTVEETIHNEQQI